MTEPMKYVASYKTSVQIAPDDWTTFRRVKVCTEATTIGDLAAWVGSPGIHITIDQEEPTGKDKNDG